MAKYSITIDNYTFCIPDYMRDHIELYIETGIVSEGSFLYYILINDFINAIIRADQQNIINIPAYTNLLYNYMPIDAWGSHEKVKNWKTDS